VLKPIFLFKPTYSGEYIYMYRKTIKELRERAIKLGAGESKMIDVKTVKTAAWVRYKCQYGCAGFGENLTCPPYSPTPEQTQKILNSFRKGILIHRHTRSVANISKIVLQVETEAFLAGYYKALSMGAGPCGLCTECKPKRGCRHPEDARPAMEACGIDVFSTARNNGFSIETLTSTRCRGDYFGLVLIE
jgi:predicted metal-binding protein